MKAVRLHQYGGPEQLLYEDQVPDPEVGPHTVLIAAVASSVNPIDWKVRSGARQKDFPRTLPTILGRDVSGVVRAVGSQVRNFKPGERVMALSDATYAELVAVEDSIVTHVPDGLDLMEAAALPLVVLTADQLVRNCIHVQKDQTVLVSGALGAVGRAAVHTAKKLGAHVIAGVRTGQFDAAHSLGAAAVLAIDDVAALARLAPVDAVADTVGGGVALGLMAKVRAGGQFGYASALPAGAVEQYPAITVTRVYVKENASKVREFADDVRDGRFSLPIGQRLALRDTALAHAIAEKGGAGKILLLV